MKVLIIEAITMCATVALARWSGYCQCKEDIALAEARNRPAGS